MNNKLAVISLSAALLSAPVAATAQEDPNITYRQKVMGSLGANIGAVSDVLKFSLPLAANIESHAAQMKRASALIPSAFEAEVAEGLTDAKPNIWQEWEEFEEYAADLEEATAALEEVAAGGDAAAIGAQLKKVGDACKQCHEEFRKPKEESYKKKM